jgi:hypothetical protein
VSCAIHRQSSYSKSPHVIKSAIKECQLPVARPVRTATAAEVAHGQVMEQRELGRRQTGREAKEMESADICKAEEIKKSLRAVKRPLEKKSNMFSEAGQDGIDARYQAGCQARVPSDCKPSVARLPGHDAGPRWCQA